MVEGVGFVFMWLNFVGRDEFLGKGGLNVTVMGAAVLGCQFVDEGTGTVNYLK